MDELNKGYEFTKAQIAELESLRAENAMLKSSGIDKVVKIIAETEVWKECETLRSRLAEIEAQEPVYQFRKECCSDWYDGKPDLSDGCGPYQTRTLYAAPVVSPDVEKLKSRSDFREMREMLRAMQAGELTVSRGIEILDMWEAGNWNDNMLPPVRHDLIDEDSMPVEIIDRLKTELEAARKDAEHKQCRIDELILEFCPSEMTADQLTRWRKCQIPAIEQAKGGV